ncbi:Methyl farnesoate epoxidase [Orchesella cincta]|uniref:Methyl farnesoate epoxidase n=1 Tax=Orchesella cincta TaxID=48709 RepID=A0A1D2MP49_ORCCI|nr:Methyl farnesoate epoxidase [Orchesella cincta]
MDIIVCYILLGLLSLLLLIYLNENLRTKRNLPPGPFRLPVIGNLIQVALADSKEPYKAFKKLGQQYGDIMSIQLGSLYSVVLNSYEDMEEYLPTADYSDRLFTAWFAERTFDKRLGIIFAKYQEPWQVLRRFCLRSLRDFGFGKRSKMHTVIESELHDIVKELQMSVKENDGIHTFDCYFTLSVLNVLWAMLAGTRYEHSDPKLLRLIKLTRDMMSSCNFGNNILLAYPEWKDWFPDWTGLTVQRKCYRETNAFFQEFIDQRRKLGAYKTNPENMVDEFIREIETNGEDTVYSDQQLVIIMNDLFVAGSETTSHTISWCILYLLLNQDIQNKLQEEIDLIVPKGTFPTVEQESQLHYLKAVLAETHRIASVVPLMVPRAAEKDTTCRKYFIPKGTYVIANIHGMHHNKDYWKDPDTFCPERFLDADGKYKPDARLKPFGFGKRLCLGARHHIDPFTISPSSKLHFTQSQPTSTFRGSRSWSHKRTSNISSFDKVSMNRNLKHQHHL